MRRRKRIRMVGALAIVALALIGCGSASTSSATPLQRWLASVPLYIAHRGGDLDWPEGTADAYAHAAAWNADLALEVPIWQTSDGVWVVSESATTGRVFGTDENIGRTPWVTLAALRTVQGHLPMARLVNDILAVYPRNRILFVDDKANADISGFFDLLLEYGGPGRFVVKSYWSSVDLPQQARKLGYTTWGYYYSKDMPQFAASSKRFDLLGLNYGAPATDFATMLATGKPLIAHVIDSASAATAALHAGASGLMVSAVQQVVPRTTRPR